MDWLFFYNDYISYNNSFKFFFKNLSSGSEISWFVRQTSENVIVNLRNIKYSTSLGIVDDNIKKVFKHSMINLKFDYLINLFNSNNSMVNNVAFYNNLFCSYVCTSSKMNYFYNIGLAKYCPLSNDIIFNKKLFGFFGNQYISSIILLFDKSDMYEINKYQNCVSFLDNAKTTVFDDSYKVKQKLDEISKSIDIENIEQAINVGKLYCELNYKILNDLKYQYDIINFRKNKIDKNNICNILYNMKLTYDECTNLFIIDFDSIITTSNELKKLDLNKFTNIKELADYLTLEKKI